MHLRQRTFATILGVAVPLLILVPLLAFRAHPDYAEWESASRAKFDAPTPLRNVRVLIASDITRLRVRAPSPLRATGDPLEQSISLPSRRWHVVQVGTDGALRLEDRDVTGPLTITSDQPIKVALWTEDGWSALGTYPGRLRMAIRSGGAIDIINEVDVETYVAAVVAREVWPTFQREAYRAQAIASRTYVLLQMKLRENEKYDVVSTQRAQVYGGLREDGTGQRALNAARDTRGIVCSWRDGRGSHLFSTYYSAACGGESQSASIFGPADDVPPLSGGVHCDFCQIAPGETYRWGPVRMNRGELFERLARSTPEVGPLGELRGIEPAGRSSASRATRYRVIGQGEQAIEMSAERFRLAVGGGTMRSTDVEIRIEGDEVVFENGRGFGHGLGLCQWGMEGQARAGRRAGEILAFYYPGAELTRVY